MGKVKEFLKRKDIVFSVDRYLIKALISGLNSKNYR